MVDKKVALVTGCSSGGLGAALCIALHKAGYRVIATARNTKKLEETDAAGIEHLELDVLSKDSLESCVKEVEKLTGRLDMLVNNAGAGFNMPVVDVDIEEAKKVYDLNVWSLITVTRAFLPLLMRSSEAKVANNISIAAYLNMPCNAIYHSSKAAANSITDTLRMELKPFNIKVSALITGSVQSNFFQNLPNPKSETNLLPEDSIYRVVPGGLTMMQETGARMTSDSDMTAPVWAEGVVSELCKASPPPQIWKGSNTYAGRLAAHLPVGLMDRAIYRTTKFNEVEEALKRGSS